MKYSKTLFIFVCKRFFQLITFMYVTKLKGRDGIVSLRTWK